jgi:hypothetical protein
MPFTVNVGPYQGGNFLFQGLSSLGQGIGGGIASASELLRKQKEDQAQSDTIFEEYLKTQKFSDDQTAHKEMAANAARKYYHLSPSARKGVAAGIIQNWLQRYHAEQIKNMQSEAAARTMQTQIAQQAMGMMGQPVTIDVPGAPGGVENRVPTDANTLPIPYEQAGQLLPQPTAAPRKLQVGVYGAHGPDLFNETVMSAIRGGGTPAAPTVTTLYAPEDTGKTNPLAHVATFGRTMTVIGAGDGEPFKKDPKTGLWYQGTGPNRKALPDNVQEDLAQKEADLKKTQSEMEKKAVPTKQGALDYIREQIGRVLPGAKPAASAAPAAQIRVVEKDGHHYEVDDRQKKVIRQID